jgi:hypothetical protein
MAGETGPTAEIAAKISNNIMKWFKWERLGPRDRNFDCVKSQKHARANKTQKHTHPTDVVFKYIDPYLGQVILLNTDLKSYSKSSIAKPNVRGALRSLAQTVECARVSQEWKERYDLDGGAEIRGMLFVYNHDAEFDESFERFLVPPKSQSKDPEDADVSGIPLVAGQYIHLMEPRTIVYLQMIVLDMAVLVRDQTFPTKDYFFFYPDQKLHKAHLEPYARPATVEMLCGPYLVIGHDYVQHGDTRTFGAGYVIYYNRPGETHLEFMYLFDVLSGYQILDGENQIRIRVAHHAPHQQIRSNFIRAKQHYIRDWGGDDYLSSKLDAIDFEVLDVIKTAFSKTQLGWEQKS